MKTTIYYFTGTGNSLAAARQIAKILGETQLVPIAAMNRSGERVVARTERVGILCPVYDLGVPLLVRDWLSRVDISATDYVFGMVTMGGMGRSALRQMDTILRKKNTRGLDLAHAVRMPGNFPPLARPPVGMKQDEILNKAMKTIDGFAREISEGKKQPVRGAFFSSLMMMLTYRSFERETRTADRSFVLHDTCTSCGTCTSVCPVGNIVMTRGKPAWQHHCELCLACLHFCPVQAIDLKMLFGTSGRGRYRHPDLTIADMKEQAGVDA